MKIIQKREELIKSVRTIRQGAIAPGLVFFFNGFKGRFFICGELK